MTNIFMAQVKNSFNFIYLKDIFKYFRYKRELKKFVKKIETGSPSLGVLWNFAEFIKYAELIYSYDNNKNNTLYSSLDYMPMSNGFKINNVDNMNITVKLYSETNKVGIDVERRNGNKLTTNFTFINEEWEIDPDEYDLLLIDRVIEIINRQMIWLLMYCIKKKSGIDLDEY